MTKEVSKIEELNAIVVVFDIRHSTAILEDLIDSDSAHIWRNALIHVKEWLFKEKERHKFIAYKFLGDGWILVYPKSVTDFVSVLGPLVLVNAAYQDFYDKEILPILRYKHPAPEITFGISRGRILKLEMNGRTEFIGRPLNEACRLQGAAGINGEGSRGFVATGVYADFRELLEPIASKLEVSLKNVAGGGQINCYKLQLKETLMRWLKLKKPQGLPLRIRTPGRPLGVERVRQGAQLLQTENV